MADLLSRLVAQTLGRGEVVQPRVAPLFASEQPLDAPEVLASVPEQEPGAAWDGLGMSETHSGAGQPAVLARGSPFVSGEGVSDRMAQLVAPPPIMVRPSGFRQTASPAIPEQPQPAAASAQDPPLTTPQTTSTTRHLAPLVPLPAHDDAMVAALSERSGDSRPDETPLTSVSLVTSHAAAVRTPPQPGADGNRRQSGDEVKEPAVHVTIGRIDVRAVLPDPPPARPAARPEPRLTLEEYSRQRREGLR